MGSFFNWIIGNGVAKYLGRLVVDKNSLEGLDIAIVDETSTILFTAEMLLGGMILYDPQGSSTATLPSAAQIVAALGDAAVKGAVFKWYLRHTGGSGEVVTLAVGSDVTFSPGTLAVDGDEMLSMLIRLDDVTSGNEAVTVYGLGLALMTT